MVVIGLLDLIHYWKNIVHNPTPSRSRTWRIIEGQLYCVRSCTPVQYSIYYKLNICSVCGRLRCSSDRSWRLHHQVHGYPRTVPGSSPSPGSPPAPASHYSPSHHEPATVPGAALGSACQSAGQSCVILVFLIIDKLLTAIWRFWPLQTSDIVKTALVQSSDVVRAAFSCENTWHCYHAFVLCKLLRLSKYLGPVQMTSFCQAVQLSKTI